MEEILKKQVKNLTELYNLIANELDIANRIIEFILPDDYYKIIRAKVIKEMEEEDER